MDQKAKVPIIILIVLILISLSLAGGGFHLFQKERIKNLNLQEKLEDANTKQRVTEVRLRESEKLIADLRLKLQESKFQIDALSLELQQERTSKLEALAKIEQLRIDLEQQKELRLDLEEKLNQAQDDVRKAEAKLSELDAQRQELELKIKDLEVMSQNVELGKIVVGPEAVPSETSGETVPETAKDSPSSNPSALEGKVLVVNRDYNFVVINLGSKDGVSLNDVFSIYRNNKYLADVKVEKVHDSMVAAGFVSGDTNKVNEGDKVVQKVK